MLNLLSVSRFYVVSLWRGHTVLCISALASLILAVSSVTALAVVARRAQLDEEQLARLLAAKKVTTIQVAQDLARSSSSQARQLPTFSSHEFASQFYETATDVGLPVDEVSYALEPVVVEAVHSTKPQLRTPQTQANVEDSTDLAWIASEEDPFSPRNWQPPPAVTTAPAPPVAVVAPIEATPTQQALPFKFVGQMKNGDDRVIYLGRGEQVQNTSARARCAAIALRSSTLERRKLS